MQPVHSIICIVATSFVRSKAATVCLFWITYSCLIVCFIMHCFKQYLCVQSLSNLMQTFTLTLQENICDVHHLVDFLVNVWQQKISVANVPHSASRTDIFMHASTISSTPCRTPCFIGTKFPVTVYIKCDQDNCGNLYNCLTFNRWISLYTVTQCTKTKEMFYQC